MDERMAVLFGRTAKLFGRTAMLGGRRRKVGCYGKWCEMDVTERGLVRAKSGFSLRRR
jgi:hypothetical protein